MIHFWMSEQAENTLDEGTKEVLLGAAGKNLPPLQDRLDLIDKEIDIVPGIQAIAAPGHTPGHIALLIESEGERLLHISDTVLHPLHLEYPDWQSQYDILPEKQEASKHRIFDKAANEQLLVFRTDTVHQSLRRAGAAGLGRLQSGSPESGQICGRWGRRLGKPAPGGSLFHSLPGQCYRRHTLLF